MPARFSDLKRWAEKRGATIRMPSSGSHWKIIFDDGWVTGITAHNALKSEIQDGYLRDIAAHFGMTLAELLRQLQPHSRQQTEVRAVEVQAPRVAPESGVFESQPNVEHQPRPPSSEETGIVKTVTVDGWSIDFRLPMLSRDGAEQARITLTELANRLGYSDKSMLKRLAERHASELAEFGISVTVTVMSQRGNGAVVQLQEPTYSPEQAAYLALSSARARSYQSSVGHCSHGTACRNWQPRRPVPEFEPPGFSEQLNL